ncbi:MAG: hypothetical protein AB7V58_06245 [Solirubrobacterales bacterium]
MDGEWVLSSVAPSVFELVSFVATDQDEAERNAKGWVEANADDVLSWIDDD